MPNSWGKFLVSSENVQTQQKLATNITNYEVYWVYPDTTRERRPERDYSEVEYQIENSGTKPWAWVARLRDGTETLKTISSLSEAGDFVQKRIAFINDYTSRRVPLRPEKYGWQGTAQGR